ncbi:MAG: hypothetical protein KA215_04430 [Flavobacterium sp.]|jgi:hypothetical protein|nr:hypothetical protein [Flavobacterium sp.]
MRQFINNILRFSLSILIPLLILLIGYFNYDPFKVLYNYSNYSYPYVIPNRDYVSTEMFIKNHNKYKYNSFIFGSSRTLAFHPQTWKKYLKPTDSPFMFDASGESIYGIYTKIKYLDSIHTPINNAIILICRDVTFRDSVNPSGHLFIKHTATSLEGKIAFQFTFVKAYLSPRFLYSFYMYTFSKNFKPYMAGYIENRKITYDSITNMVRIIDQENEITHYPDKYYKEHENVFYKRQNEITDSIARINPTQIMMLKEINKILQKNNTNVKVIISPLYEQIKFNPEDIKVLKSIFHNDLYDFSGKNYFTDSKYNYYENSHYRPLVGDSILQFIYNH